MNKTSVIDFSNPSTFPLKLQQIVSDYYNKKPEIIKAVLETPPLFAMPTSMAASFCVNPLISNFIIFLSV